MKLRRNFLSGKLSVRCKDRRNDLLLWHWADLFVVVCDLSVDVVRFRNSRVRRVRDRLVVVVGGRPDLGCTCRLVERVADRVNRVVDALLCCAVPL